jgi:hypothetical protein
MATAKKKPRKKPRKTATQSPGIRPANRRRARPVGQTAPNASHPEGALTDKMERLNRVLSKTIELAEAALQLGVRLVDSVGRGGREDARSRLADVDRGGSGDFGNAGEAQPSTAASGPPDNRVGNRTLLHPGAEVRIAFSINNESTEKRTIQLQLSPLVGEARGARLAEGALKVKPERIEIEPLDFEKILLVGRIPANSLPDTYAGGIVVAGADQPISIPLRLVVS